MHWDHAPLNWSAGLQPGEINVFLARRIWRSWSSALPFMECLHSLWRMHVDHEPWKAPNVGQASRLPSQRASASDSVPSALPTEAGETPALPCGSWRVKWTDKTALTWPIPTGALLLD